MTLQQLQAEIRKRQRRLPVLHAKLRRAQAAVQAIMGQIGEIESVAGQAGHAGGARGRRMGGAGRAGEGGGTGRVRPRNKTNLVEALARVLSGATMSVIDAAHAVRKAGYKTNAANFRVMVNQALIKSGKFKKVARGQYTAA